MGGGDSSKKRKGRRDKISSKTRSGKRESKKRRLSYDSDGSPSDVDSLHLKRCLSSTARTVHRRRITKKSKHRRRDSSMSDYSDYQSVSLDSDSSSTDEDDYKIKKGRKKIRAGLKDVKRKDSKRSIISIGDVAKQGRHKRNKLDKGRVSRPIKKSLKRKSRKHLSSSSGSESKSCSASQSSSSGDDRHQKNKVVIDKKKGSLRHKVSRKSKPKNRDRSPSFTPSDREGDPSFSGGNSDEELFLVDNSRRLKSVITVIDRAHDEEESRWEKDPHKEEIVRDQNDYPSSRSLDCDESGNKMELCNQSIVAFSERISIENTAGEEVRELGTPIKDDGDYQSEVGYVEIKKKEIDTSGPVGAVQGDLLESILRQKALENLKKFRKVPQTFPRSNMAKINNETSVTGSSDRTVDTFDSNSVIQNHTSDAQEMTYSGGHLLQGEIAEAVKLPDSEFVEKKPQIAKPSILHSSNASTLLACSEEDKSLRSQVVKAEAVIASDISPEDGGTKASIYSNVEQTYSAKPTSREQDNNSISRNVEARAVSGGDTNTCSSSNVELASSVEPNSGEHTSGKGNEAKNGSEFEQKTMSVMRGGELVQVNYKVYIPKKAPALATARRQLRSHQKQFVEGQR